VGDISCQPGSPLEHEKATDVCDQGIGSTVRNSAQNATAQQVEAMSPVLVAVLGDEQYQNGYYSDFENSFDKYWGAFKVLQRPAPGNHEFYDNHGQTGAGRYERCTSGAGSPGSGAGFGPLGSAASCTGLRGEGSMTRSTRPVASDTRSSLPAPTHRCPPAAARDPVRPSVDHELGTGTFERTASECGSRRHSVVAFPRLVVTHSERPASRVSSRVLKKRRTATVRPEVGSRRVIA
jgi:hypothetical protein